jgi:hypothetical protein
MFIPVILMVQGFGRLFFGVYISSGFGAGGLDQPGISG